MSDLVKAAVSSAVDSIATNADKLTVPILALAILGGFIAVILLVWKGM